jgi:hypothetical protein
MDKTSAQAQADAWDTYNRACERCDSLEADLFVAEAARDAAWEAYQKSIADGRAEAERK